MAVMFNPIEPGSDTPKKVTLGNLINSTFNLRLHIQVAMRASAPLGLPAIINEKITNYIPPTLQSQDGYQFSRLVKIAEELAGDNPEDVVKYLTEIWAIDQANQEPPIDPKLFAKFLDEVSKAVSEYYNEGNIYDLFNVTRISENFKSQLEHNYAMACGNTQERSTTKALVSDDIQAGLGIEFSEGIVQVEDQTADHPDQEDPISNAHTQIDLLFELLDSFIEYCGEYDKQFVQPLQQTEQPGRRPGPRFTRG